MPGQHYQVVSRTVPLQRFKRCLKPLLQAAVLFFLLLGVGCGSRDATSSQPTPASPGTATPTRTPTPSPTATSSPPPTPSPIPSPTPVPTSPPTLTPSPSPSGDDSAFYKKFFMHYFGLIVAQKYMQAYALLSSALRASMSYADFLENRNYTLSQGCWSVDQIVVSKLEADGVTWNIGAELTSTSCFDNCTITYYWDAYFDRAQQPPVIIKMALYPTGTTC